MLAWSLYSLTAPCMFGWHPASFNISLHDWTALCMLRWRLACLQCTHMLGWHPACLDTVIHTSLSLLTLPHVYTRLKFRMHASICLPFLRCAYVHGWIRRHTPKMRENRNARPATWARTRNSAIVGRVRYPLDHSGIKSYFRTDNLLIEARATEQRR